MHINLHAPIHISFPDIYIYFIYITGYFIYRVLFNWSREKKGRELGFLIFNFNLQDAHLSETRRSR